MDTEKVLISKCHRAEAWEMSESKLYRCSKCKEKCEVEEVCAFCLGDGEVSTDEQDGEGHTMRGVGTQTCPCSVKEPEYDNQER